MEMVASDISFNFDRLYRHTYFARNANGTFLPVLISLVPKDTGLIIKTLGYLYENTKNMVCSNMQAMTVLSRIQSVLLDLRDRNAPKEEVAQVLWSFQNANNPIFYPYSTFGNYSAPSVDPKQQDQGECFRVGLIGATYRKLPQKEQADAYAKISEGVSGGPYLEYDPTGKSEYVERVGADARILGFNFGPETTE
jgi:hypothetical protein